jgi:hypothetical protein
VKRLLREPLVHFLLLGAALFGAYALLGQGKPSAQDEIIVSAGQIEALAATFTKIWQRPPTAQEMKAQIDQYVKEEMLSREAMALGLDKNDTVIRRRLQQKMEFLAEDFTAADDPTEAELADYLARHPDQFAEEPRFTFRQIFLSPDERGDRLETEATRLLADLRKQGADTDIAALGDGTLLPHDLTDEPRRAVASQFGSEFASALGKLNPGEWSGPIQSGYGVHLVFVSRRTEGRVPALDEVRRHVKRELMNERRQAANRRFMDELLNKYHVVVQWPESEAAPTAVSVSLKP